MILAPPYMSALARANAWILGVPCGRCRAWRARAVAWWVRPQWRRWAASLAHGSAIGSPGGVAGSGQDHATGAPYQPVVRAIGGNLNFALCGSLRCNTAIDTHCRQVIIDTDAELRIPLPREYGPGSIWVGQVSGTSIQIPAALLCEDAQIGTGSCEAHGPFLDSAGATVWMLYNAIGRCDGFTAVQSREGINLRYQGSVPTWALGEPVGVTGAPV